MFRIFEKTININKAYLSQPIALYGFDGNTRFWTNSLKAPLRAKEDDYEK